MKIAVLMPVMAPEVANDWKYVQHCLNRSLRSILNNNSVDLRVFVMCQSKPANMILDDRIVFLKTDIPIPDKHNKTAKEGDKSAKTLQGFHRAADFEPDYIMRVDADDMISRHLFQTVVDNPGYDAYCVNCGYEWWEGRKSMTIRHYFHKYCGSTFIGRYNTDLWPLYLGNKSPDVTPRVCDNPHTHIEEALLAGGFNVYYFNKPMVVYLTGGIDQLRVRKVRLRRKIKDLVFALFRNRRLNKSLCDEFAIQK